MPFENQNLNIRYYRGTEPLEYSQITVDLDDKANTSFLPSTVHKIYESNVIDTSDFSGDVNVGQYIVLTKQDIKSENGLYQQTAASTAVKVTNPTKNTFFLDVSNEFNRAVYLTGTENFFTVNFNKVLFGTSIQTTSGTSLDVNRIFNFPVAYDRPATVNTIINGIGSDYSLYYGNFKIMYHNTGTSIIELDNFSYVTHRSITNRITLPTVTFGTSLGTSGGTIDLVSNNNKTINWYIHSEMLF